MLPFSRSHQRRVSQNELGNLLLRQPQRAGQPLHALPQVVPGHLFHQPPTPPTKNTGIRGVTLREQRQELVGEDNPTSKRPTTRIKTTTETRVRRVEATNLCTRDRGRLCGEVPSLVFHDLFWNYFRRGRGGGARARVWGEQLNGVLFRL